MSVLVFTENWDGKFKKLSFELASYASKVAEMLSTNAVALSIGNVDEGELKKLGNYGIQKIISINQESLKILDNQAYTNVIAEIARKEGSNVIVLSNNNMGKGLAPRLSVNLKAAIGAGVSKLPLNVAPFTVYKRAFSGNAFAVLELKSEIKIITLAQNSFELIETPNSVTIENAQVDVDGVIKTRVKEVQKQTGYYWKPTHRFCRSR